MDEDLQDIEKVIAERKAVAEQSAQPPQTPQTPPVPIDGNARAKQLVSDAFGAAIVDRVQSNENVQEELLDSADTVIHNELNAIKARADREDKETHFNNKKGACECFGYNEATTEKWAVNLMNFWHNVMTAIWLFIGFFTFAPITFIAKKIKVIFKQAWVAVALAIIIYLAVVLTPVLTSLLIK